MPIGSCRLTTMVPGGIPIRMMHVYLYAVRAPSTPLDGRMLTVRAPDEVTAERLALRFLAAPVGLELVEQYALPSRVAA